MNRIPDLYTDTRVQDGTSGKADSEAAMRDPKRDVEGE